jgi:L-threonylcarbamoyladenylate synthase
MLTDEEWMQTRIVTINDVVVDQDIIREAAVLIRSGQLVAFPTETVYGLGANALDPTAVSRIFEAKGRPSSDPLIVHISSADCLAEVAIDVPDLAHRLIENFWPGPLTLVLKKNHQIASAVSAGLPTVAVRMPAHPIALALLKASDVPIAAPSANLFAHTSPTTAQHVLSDLENRIPLILDGGPTTVGLESTIVDLTGDHPRLLRPGGLPVEVIARLLPDLEVITRHARPEDGAMEAPGMLLKHYAPRAELRLFDGPDEKLRLALARSAEELLAQNKRIGLLIANEDLSALTRFSVPAVPLGSLNNLQQVAHRLYAGLRTLDEANVEIILARTYPATGLGVTIRDRLIRAAQGHIID